MLPTLHWKTAPPGAKERLRRWFEEWLVDQRMRRALPDDAQPLQPESIAAPVDEDFHEQHVARFDSNVKVGEIRLMSARMFPVFRRFMYFAVIAEWPGDEFVVAPFGPYSEPATRTEWLTGREDEALRVLCLWNGRAWPRESIQRSWVVDEFIERELADARAVFNHAVSGTALEDRLISTVGSPISFPNDPRLRYQSEEISLFTPVELPQRRGESEQGEGSQQGRRTNRPQDQQPGSNRITPPSGTGRGIRPPNIYAEPPRLRVQEGFALSADDDRYVLLKAVYVISELSLRLVFRLDSDNETVSVQVTDMNGTTSSILDGTQIVNSSGEIVATIEQAFAHLAQPMIESGFAMRDREGRIFTPKAQR
ncbi:MAG: hypothetical protein ACXWBP_09995 [Limisphaerales bacterium]